MTDRLRQLKAFYPERFAWMYPLPVQFSKPIRNNRLYYDTTTLWAANVRNLLRGEDEDGNALESRLLLPDEQNLIAQMSVRKYAFTPDSRVRLESKDKMKERGLGSPDEADCLFMACIPVDRQKLKRRGRHE